MLSYTEFREFASALRDEPVFTVYISGVCHDPSAKATWRVQADHTLNTARNGLIHASHEERQRFEQCVRLLESALAASPSIHTAPGWVAFITPDAVQRAEPLPIDVPTIAVWGIGPHVTPYVCALSEDHRGVVAVTDARQVTLYEYRNGTITRRHVIHAQAHLHPPLHMGDVPRQGFHPGVRGETGREAAQRARGTGTERLVREAADQVLRLALRQRAPVHVMTGVAGRSLDDAGGVVAQLRYGVPSGVPAIEPTVVRQSAPMHVPDGMV